MPQQNRFVAMKPQILFSLKNTNVKTRPDTRPPVADGWAGADMRVFPLFDSITSTDQPTDQPTDRRTKRGIESRARD